MKDLTIDQIGEIVHKANEKLAAVFDMDMACVLADESYPLNFYLFVDIVASILVTFNSLVVAKVKNLSYCAQIDIDELVLIDKIGVALKESHSKINPSGDRTKIH